MNKLDDEAHGLWQVRSFHSLAEGAHLLSEAMGYPITMPRLNYLIGVIRKDPNRWGFTVPDARCGRRGYLEQGPRFICVAVEKGTDPSFDKHEQSQVFAGWASTLGYTETRMSNEVEAMLYSIQYLYDPDLDYVIQRAARDMRRAVEDISDIRTELRRHGIFA